LRQKGGLHLHADGNRTRAARGIHGTNQLSYEQILTRYRCLAFNWNKDAVFTDETERERRRTSVNHRRTTGCTVDAELDKMRASEKHLAGTCRVGARNQPLRCSLGCEQSVAREYNKLNSDETETQNTPRRWRHAGTSQFCAGSTK
jgi:hypothetical protein